MARPILMPKFGQMTETSVLTTWHKREGDAVRKGDVLFEIETDKSAMEVEAFDDGVLLKRVVAEGEEVAVSAVCAWIGEAGEKVPEHETEAGTGFEAPAAIAPLAPTSGAGESFGEAGVADEPAPELPAERGAVAPTSAPAPAAAGRRLRISPRATRLAAEAGIDPRSISGSGPGGRIVERDVQATIDAGAASPVAPSPVAPAVPAPGGAAEPSPMSDVEDAPRLLGRMRRVIAERLTLSATTIPTFAATVAVDVTALLGLRQELKAQGTSVSVTDYVLSAVAQSLVEFPDVNARTDGISVWPRRHIHLGLAVSLPAGLVVPVIRDADRLSIEGLHDEAVRLAAAAREGTLPPDALSGSTFTVSNLGMFGVDEFTAIINPGESGILAVGSATETPVVVGGGFAVRSIMKLTLTADHRLVDGEMAARFLNAIRRRLEDHRAMRRESAWG